MKEYIYQFYNEGFATTFYIKPINFLNKKLKNKKIKNFSIYAYKTLYTIVMIMVAIIVLIKKLKI